MCIILVEDEPLIREILAETLRDAGHEVIELEDGAAALALARSPPPVITAVVTDFHMPSRIDGYQVATRFREIFPSLPVVVMTGRPEVFRADWRERFDFHLLRKPFLPSELVRVIDEATRPAGGHV